MPRCIINAAKEYAIEAGFLDVEFEGLRKTKSDYTKKYCDSYEVEFRSDEKRKFIHVCISKDDFELKEVKVRPFPYRSLVKEAKANEFDANRMR
ncbi:MAG: hypothetical protein H0Z28_11970 [Archaeoglobus sp.]|nr:hypothetical protein [Archaeoglobus sp.]